MPGRSGTGDSSLLVTVRSPSLPSNSPRLLVTLDSLRGAVQRLLSSSSFMSFSERGKKYPKVRHHRPFRSLQFSASFSEIGGRGGRALGQQCLAPPGHQNQASGTPTPRRTGPFLWNAWVRASVFFKAFGSPMRSQC